MFAQGRPHARAMNTNIRYHMNSNHRYSRYSMLSEYGRVVVSLSCTRPWSWVHHGSMVSGYSSCWTRRKEGAGQIPSLPYSKVSQILYKKNFLNRSQSMRNSLVAFAQHSETKNARTGSSSSGVEGANGERHGSTGANNATNAKLDATEEGSVLPDKIVSSDGKESASSTSEPERKPPKKHTSLWSRITGNMPRFSVGSPLRFVINIMALFFLMRFWPVPSNQNPLGRPDAIKVKVAYSEFLKSVKKNEISKLVVDGVRISYILKPSSDIFTSAPEELDRNSFSFETTRPTDLPTPYDLLISNGVQFSALDKRGGGFATFFNYALLLLVMIAVLNKFPLRMPNRGAGRRHLGSGSGGGGSGSQDGSSTQVTFDDVAGVDEAKEELQEVVEYLRDPERFAKLGGRPPSGVLLVGPPGTGKTLLAKAVAGEAGVPFFSISASEFVELYVGMGALRVRELFQQARREAPAIVFIDEIDAVAKGRESRLRSVGNDEREQTLNQLLTELDGFDSHADSIVICIAATNRPDVLDSALLRPGRFDRRVPVERPDRIGRQEILQTHIRRKSLPLSESVNIDSLASQTAGFTGADLANVVNEAALLAGRRNSEVVTMAEFDAAILRQIAGLEKKRSILRGEEKAVVARHEAGHAIVAAAISKLIPTTPPVERLSIIPRSGGALGFTYSPPEEDRALMFEHEIRGQLAMLMGGRAAEAATSAAVSTGASDDINRATNLAHRAVTEFGLSKKIGPLSVAALAAGSEQYAMLMDGGGEIGRRVETEVHDLLEGALNGAKDAIIENKKLHSMLSSDLERDERIDGDALKRILEAVEAPQSLRAFVIEGLVHSELQ